MIKRDTAKHGMTRLKETIIEALAGGDVDVLVRRPSKSRAQEKMYHALINEVAGQIRTYGNRYAPEVWKALFIAQFAKERAAMGQPLRKQGATVPALDGSGELVTIRPSTTGLSVSEASDFIEFIYATGVEIGVNWGCSAQQIMNAVRDGQYEVEL